MVTKKKVIYKGKTYYLQSTGRYYSTRKKVLGERLLHRVIYVEYFGRIPKGKCIHHKNGDWQDNRKKNLALMDKPKHSSKHARESFRKPIYRKRNKEILAGIRGLTKPWHRSKKGRLEHSKNSKEAWVNKKQYKKVCLICREGYLTFYPKRSKFCSHNCAEKSLYRKKHNLVGAAN